MIPENLRGAAPFEVSVQPLRDAFLHSGLSAADVARRLGWVKVNRQRSRPRLVADAGRVTRSLGLRPGDGYMRARCSRETAVRLCDAIGLDPVDFDL